MTGRELYAAALDIAGIRLKSGGIPATADNLSARSVSLINILIAENSFLNGLLDPGATAPVLISSLDDTVSLDAKLLGSALPYGLCALLMLPDDPDEADFPQSGRISRRFTVGHEKKSHDNHTIRRTESKCVFGR